MPIALTIQMVRLNQRYESNDVTWSLVDPTVWNQIALNLSIVTACVPSLKGVIDTFWSGASMFTVPHQYSSSDPSGTFALRSIVPSKFRTNKSQAGVRTNNSAFDPRPSRNETNFEGAHLHQRDPSKFGRSDSQVSLHGNAIMRTVEYEIYHEPNGSKSPVGGNRAVSDGVSQTSTEAGERLL